MCIYLWHFSYKYIDRIDDCDQLFVENYLKKSFPICESLKKMQIFLFLLVIGLFSVVGIDADPGWSFVKIRKISNSMDGSWDRVRFHFTPDNRRNAILSFISIDPHTITVLSGAFYCNQTVKIYFDSNNEFKAYEVGN